MERSSKRYARENKSLRDEGPSKIEILLNISVWFIAYDTFISKQM